MPARDDKRQAPRRRMLKGALIVFNDRQSTVLCTVRDLSASGARLDVRNSVGVPDRFILLIELDGIEVDCQIVRRKEMEVAVRFLGSVRQLRRTRSQVVNSFRPATKVIVRRKPKL